MKPLFVTTSGQGTALVALHGWGMNSSVWDRIRPALEEKFRVSWIDLPGHGENYDCKATSLDDIVEQILVLIPENSQIMGWSLGGLIAQVIAQRVPDKINSLLLINSTPRFSQTSDWLHAMPQKVLDTFAINLKQDLEGTIKRFIALQFMGVSGGEAKRIQREISNKILSSIKTFKNRGGGYSYKEALELGLTILKETDFRKVVVNQPQYWLFAKKDRLVPAEVINDLKLIRPNAQITLLENAGHAPFMTHPTEFLDHVVPFLERYAG